MIVLDTNVVSELARPRAEPAVVSWLDSCPPAQVYLTSITLAESLYGVARLPNGRRRDDIARRLEHVISTTFTERILPFDARAALHFAVVAASRERAGARVQDSDGKIAAICRAHGAALATRNVRDFAGTGVELINPWVWRRTDEPDRPGPTMAR